MKTTMTIGLLTGVFALAVPVVHAADGEAIARANNCMACHGVTDKRMMGPSFSEIAARYEKKGKSVEAALAEKIRRGGSGEWGPMAMPAQPQLTDADARAIVKWMLDR